MRSNRRLLASVFALVLVFGAASRAEASSIVGTGNDGNGGYGIGFSFSPSYNLVIGQSFTMGGTSQVADSITVYLNGLGVGTFTLQLMNQIGPTATGANVLTSLVGALPNNSSGHSAVTFNGLSINLAASQTYYLVITSAAGPNTGWGSFGPTLIEPLGTVGSAFVGIRGDGGVGDYTYLDPNSPATFDHDNDPNTPEIFNNTSFLITGNPATPAAVPEPGSLILLGTGLAGAAIFLRRKRS